MGSANCFLFSCLLTAGSSSNHNFHDAAGNPTEPPCCLPRWYSGEHHRPCLYAHCWNGRLFAHIYTICYDTRSWARRSSNHLRYGALRIIVRCNSILAVTNQSKVASITLAVTISAQVMHGLGRHSSQLDADDLDCLLKVCRASRDLNAVPSWKAACVYRMWHTTDFSFSLRIPPQDLTACCRAFGRAYGCTTLCLP